MRQRVHAQILYFILLVLIGVATGSAHGQACDVDVPLRPVDRRGEPISSITSDQLKARVGSSTVPVISISPTPNLGFILLLDTTPSMKEVWKESIAAARQLENKAAGNFNLFTFSEKIERYARTQPQSEDLLNHLLNEGAPKPPRGTALYDSLIEIAQHTRLRATPIIVISDGGDNASYHSADATASLFLRSSWPAVFALILDYDETNPRRSYFKRIPEATGGFVVYPPSASKVSTAADELAAVVLNSFAAKLRLTRAITDSTKVSLEVVRPDGKRSKDIKLLYPSELSVHDSCHPN